MGNAFSEAILELSKHKINGRLPAPDAISQQFFNKTPFKIYRMIYELHINPYFNFVMNRSDFFEFTKEWFDINTQSKSDAVCE